MAYGFKIVISFNMCIHHRAYIATSSEKKTITENSLTITTLLFCSKP